MKKSEINAIIKELAEYTRMKEELEAQMDELKDQIKAHMTEENLDEMLTEDGSHVVWKEVISRRFDSTKFKQSEWGELYQDFCKPSVTKPFKFYA